MAYGGDVAVFLGGESHFTTSGSEGIFLLREHCNRCYNGVNNVHEFEGGISKVEKFNIHYLQSPDSLNSLLDRYLHSKLCFSGSAWALTESIFKYLVSSFQFKSVPTSSYSRKPKIIIVVDVHVAPIVNSYLSEEDFYDDEEEESNSLEYVDVGVDQDKDMSDDLTDSSIEEDYEADDNEQESSDDENLMDDANNNVSNMGEEEDYLKLQRENYLYNIFSSLSPYVDSSEPIAMDELEYVLEKVESAVKIYTLTEDDPSEEADNCPICVQRFLSGTEVAIMPCSHGFHLDCISKWLQKSNSCPMCRTLCTTQVQF